MQDRNHCRSQTKEKDTMSTWRRLGRLICTALYFFFSGVEYAVILPTLNGYLNSLEAPAGFIGVLMASFSFTGLISSPIFGLIFDKTKSSKSALILSNIFEVAGNVLYFAGTNFYVVWTSRLVAGIGSGSASAIIAMVARTTAPGARTSVLSMLMSMRQIGLIVGPGFNIFFHSLHSTIGRFPVNEFTSPGLLMTGIWLVHTVLVMLFYYDETPDPPNGVAGDTNDEESSLSIRHMYDEFVREEVIFCLALTFLIMFLQLGLESAVTPLTLLLFGWGGLYNSYFYCGAGLAIVLSYAVLGAISRRLDDRKLIILGLISLLSSFSVLLGWSIPLYIMGDFLETPSWVFPMFIVSICLLLFGLPFAYTSTTSLYSKITSMESQGFNQGVRLVAMGIGQILGPIWAAPMATSKRLPFLTATYMLLTSLLCVMLFMSYNKLAPSVTSELRTNGIGHDSDSEQTPLISNGTSAVA